MRWICLGPLLAVLVFDRATCFAGHLQRLKASLERARELALDGHLDKARISLLEVLKNAEPHQQRALARHCLPDAGIDDVFKSQISSEKALQLQKFLRAQNYSANAVQEWFGVTPPSPGEPRTMAPYYVKQPDLAKSSPALKSTHDSLGTMILVFLMGYAVEKHELMSGIGPSATELLETLGVLCEAEVGTEVLVWSRVQICPVDLCVHSDIVPAEHDACWFVTDWNPQWGLSLSLSEDPVMYIGPDSLALITHSPLQVGLRRSRDKDVQVLDLCCGSGVQGITAAKLVHCHSSTAVEVTFVDLNPRALRFSDFNANLNGVSTTAQSGAGEVPVQAKILRSDVFEAIPAAEAFDVVLANPPFVPVPVAKRSTKLSSRIRQRYSMFADGGDDGLAVLKKILRGVHCRLRPGGFLAVVSEFFFPREQSCSREDWCVHWATLIDQLVAPDELGDVRKEYIAMLLYNEPPLDITTYCRRRGGREEEIRIWMNHLTELLDLAWMSPGLLFLRKTKAIRGKDEEERSWTNENGRFVLKGIETSDSNWGLWTPHYLEGVAKSRCAMKELFGS